MKASMNPPKLIATQRDFGRFIEQISHAKHLAVDSESNSYFAYRPRICLIQISANNKDFILDPLTLKDLTGLGRILSDSSVEKIIHAAENDLIGFKRDYRFQVMNIFDTSVSLSDSWSQKIGTCQDSLRGFWHYHEQEISALQLGKASFEPRSTLLRSAGHAFSNKAQEPTPQPANRE